MFRLRKEFSYGNDRRVSYHDGETLLAALVSAFWESDAIGWHSISADMRDAIYSDMFHSGMSERFGWQRVYLVEGEV